MKTIKIDADDVGTIEFVVDKIVMWSVEPLIYNVLTIRTISTVDSFEYETKEEMYEVAQLLKDAVWGKK